MAENGNPLTALAESMREIQSAFAAIAKTVKPIAEGITTLIDVNRRLVEAGWLPHHTTPFEIVLEADPDSLGDRLAAYYESNWEKVSDEIHSRAETYDIDAEAKETFREALRAHGHGLYRSSCRVLFPEIERVLWIEAHDGDWNKEHITSQREFIELVGNLPAGIALTDPWAYELYKRLSNHLYVKVNETNREQFKAIPNRHAAVHGRIVYSTAQHSMNTIIMADYVFAVISATKEYGRQTGQLKE